MDKIVIFAVAGSGKTTCIIDKLNLIEKSILVTYTINNTETLKRKVINKFGYFPANIVVYTYFSFLYSFCYKPFCSYKIRDNGIAYNLDLPKYVKKDQPDYYLTKKKWLYSNRLSKLLIECEVVVDINIRLSKYFDNLFIDEVQDFAANDFNFLKEISKTNINMLFVGDFYQHTFDTGRDGSTEKNLHKNYEQYKQKFIEMGLSVDESSLIKSRRCTKNVCDFVSNKIGINIESSNQTESTIQFIEDDNRIKEIVNDNAIIKLFYQSHAKYDCFSGNWGKAKGEEYENICVVLNQTTLTKYNNNTLDDLAPITKNKFYVACTRTKNNIYFISESKLNTYKK
jgi:DNA helicase-2/ATP-dependent DNA helicase PcrA